MPDIDDEHDMPFSFKEHSKHLLYCGTQVLQVNEFFKNLLLIVKQ